MIEDDDGDDDGRCCGDKRSNVEGMSVIQEAGKGIAELFLLAEERELPPDGGFGITGTVKVESRMFYVPRSF